MYEEDAVDVYMTEQAQEELRRKADEEFYEDETEDEEEDEDNENGTNMDSAEDKAVKEISTTMVSMQFKQISVGDHVACGITLQEEDLMCWYPDEDTLVQDHLDILPKFVRGPFRQVSVGTEGVCVLRRQPSISDMEPDKGHDSLRHKIVLNEEGRIISSNMERILLGTATVDIAAEKAAGRHPGMHCWGVITQKIPEAVWWWPVGWDQIKVAVAGPPCAVSMESELFCFSHPTDKMAQHPDIVIL